MLLDLQHVTFRFNNAKPLLNNISFQLLPGKIYALMGGNGSGKTTLFNIISGFLRPQSGQIRFFQRSFRGNKSYNLTSLSPYRVNKAGIGRTFQDLRMIQRLTAIENVILSMPGNPTDNWIKALLPPVVFRSKKRSLTRLAEEILSNCYISNVWNSPAGEISYGQQKLLSIANCIATDASLILLDEPVAGINPALISKISSLLKQLKDDNKTILLIEHNADFIADVGEQIFFLKDGNLNCYDSLKALKSDQAVMEAYI